MPRRAEVWRRTFLQGSRCWRPSTAPGPGRRSRVAGGRSAVHHQACREAGQDRGLRTAQRLQFVTDGLWVLDQIDPNKTFKVRPHDGSIVQELRPNRIHGSGVTYGNGALWIASTKMTDPAIPPRTLEDRSEDRQDAESWATPRSGMYGSNTPRSTVSGAHGLKWVDGDVLDGRASIGEAVPDGARDRRDRPNDPGARRADARTGGDKRFLWCVESKGRVIYKLDPADGTAVAGSS